VGSSPIASTKNLSNAAKQWKLNPNRHLDAASDVGVRYQESGTKFLTAFIDDLFDASRCAPTPTIPVHRTFFQRSRHPISCSWCWRPSPDRARSMNRAAGMESSRSR
jgi:hypothetical protein